MSSSTAGLLDTNVVVHALGNDSNSEECRRFLAAAREGRVRVLIEPLVLHEITYVLTRRGPRLSAMEVAGYIQTLLNMKGAEGDVRSMSDALVLWQQSPSLGFVDCYLAAKARLMDVPVYTKNVRHLRRLGADAPDPLPES